MNSKITSLLIGASACALGASAQLTVGGYGEATYSYNFFRTHGTDIKIHRILPVSIMAAWICRM